MYTCGPTVWNYAHIGNFRTFVFEDILRRYLKFKGYKVNQVMNITDIEDKIISGMKQFHMSREELVNFYENAFFEDLEKLGVEKAEHYPRATDHIPEMLTLIKTLLKKKYAYRSDDGSIYYDVSRFKRYGRLSGVKRAELKAGARVTHDHYDKREASDFALWKAWDEEDGVVFWQTELGKGRPGWHIECSAMSMKYLGPSFDIHTGGIDNKFPHHENEIAQSEAATGKRFVKYWLHSDFLNINGEKMSKSLGNMFTLRQLLDEGWDSRAVRMFLISGHYRDELNLNDESLAQAEANIEKIDQFVKRVKGANASPEGNEDVPFVSIFLKDFERAMDDDLNVPVALAALFRFQRQVNTLIDRGSLSRKYADSVLEALKKVDGILGIFSFQNQSLPPALANLIEEREAARARKDFKRADELRAELKKQGVTIQDTPSGPVWKMD